MSCIHAFAFTPSRLSPPLIWSRSHAQRLVHVVCGGVLSLHLRRSSQPYLCIARLALPGREEGIERCDEAAGIGARPVFLGCEDEAGVAFACGEQRLGERTIVADILRHNSPTLGSRVVEHLLVRRAGPGRLVNRNDVVPTSAELAGNEARVHLVEKELQEAACRARATRSAASAASSFRRIHSSISDRCSS